MIVLGGVGLVLLTTATRIGELSVISHFRYTRIFFASAVGVMILVEKIDFITYLGRLDCCRRNLCLDQRTSPTDRKAIALEDLRYWVVQER
jgi:hypothetical protein